MPYVITRNAIMDDIRAIYEYINTHEPGTYTIEEICKEHNVSTRMSSFYLACGVLAVIGKSGRRLKYAVNPDKSAVEMADYVYEEYIKNKRVSAKQRRKAPTNDNQNAEDTTVVCTRIHRAQEALENQLTHLEETIQADHASFIKRITSLEEIIEKLTATLENADRNTEGMILVVKELMKDITEIKDMWK